MRKIHPSTTNRTNRAQNATKAHDIFTRLTCFFERKHDLPNTKTVSHETKWDLEAEDLVIELGHWLGRLEAQRSGGFLHRADHGRRTTDENLHILCGSRGPFLCPSVHNAHGTEKIRKYLNHVGGNESNATRPALRRVIQYVVDAEVGVLLRELVQVLLQQNIFQVDVGKDQINLSLVLGVLGDGSHDLEHGSDSSSSSNHAESANHVGSIDKLPLGATGTNGLTNPQIGDVLGDVTGGIRLDQEIEVAKVFVR
jgi:hypothetical protein